MNGLKETLQKNQTLYFVLMTVLVVVAIVTISFSSQIAQWLTPAILTVVSIIAATITMALTDVVKQKYKTNVRQVATSQLEQFQQMKEALQKMHEQLQVEQTKQGQKLESKLQTIEQAQVAKMKELQQTIELNKQLAVVKLTEKMTEQFEQLSTTAASNFDESKQQLVQVQAEIDTSFTKQQTQSTVLQQFIETMHTELVEHSRKQHKQARELAQQNAAALTEQVSTGVKQSIEQTNASEKLLTEILTTLARNVLTASNMMKDTFSKQHSEALSHIEKVDAAQQMRMQLSSDSLTERVLYVVDQLNNHSKAATTQLHEQTKAILTDLSHKYECAATALNDKAMTDEKAWASWLETAAAHVDVLTATMTNKMSVLEQQVQQTHAEQADAVAQSTHTIVETVQTAAAMSDSTNEAKFEQLQQSLEAAVNEQIAAVTKTEEALLQESASHFETLQQNIGELQQQTTAQMDVSKHTIMQAVDDLTAFTNEQAEKVVADVMNQLQRLEQQQTEDSGDLKKAMLAQVISVSNDVVQGFEQLETATTSKADAIHHSVMDLQQQFMQQHSATTSQLEQLHERVSEVPIQQQQHIVHLQQKLDEQFATSQQDWQAVKSQQVVQLEEARAFAKRQETVQKRQAEQQQHYFSSMEQAIDEATTTLQQPLSNLKEQLAQVESKELKTLQQQLQQLSTNVNDINARLLQQIAGVKTEVSKNNIAAVQQQLTVFEAQLTQLKTSVTVSKSDVTKNIKVIEQLVKKDVAPQPELKQILQSIIQITGQVKEHETLMLHRIEMIDVQLSAMQKVSASSAATATTKRPTTSKVTQTTKKAAVQTPTKSAVEQKPKNRTEVIEDKANGITMHNKFVNGVLTQSDMLQKDKISYTAFYNAKGVLEKTINFDKNGTRLTEMVYYPTGAVKERTEYVMVKGKQQKEVTKFAMDGKRLY